MSTATTADGAGIIELARQRGLAVEWANAARPAAGRRRAGASAAARGRWDCRRNHRARSPKAQRGSMLRMRCLRCAPLVTGTVDEPITLPGASSQTRRRRRSSSLKSARGTMSGRSARATAHARTRDLIPDIIRCTCVIGWSRWQLRPSAASRSATSTLTEWGVAVQLYGLRHAGDGGIGSTEGLSAFAVEAANCGGRRHCAKPHTRHVRRRSGALRPLFAF